jgi:hypothetical protein
MATASERYPRLAQLARSPLLWIAVMAILGFVIRSAKTPGGRGVSLLADVPPINKAPGQTAALFVGVQHFTNPSPAVVEYAVDDAVDLASAFEERIGDPKRIALAITGEPHKKESQAALQKLRDGGATIEPATKEAIARLLEKQASLAGGNGELILSFATHGISVDGVHYVLASGSSFEDRDSLLSTPEMLDAAARVRRSIVFLDACRERITTARGVSHRVNTKAPSLRAMKQYAGQVVFSAAAGKYTYDDPIHKNGVFTAAVVDGLHCKAKHDANGDVTVATLHDYVDTRVRRWMKSNHHNSSGPAIQVNVDGDSATLPLARCEVIPEIGDVKFTNLGALDVFDTSGHFLWGHQFAEPVTDANFAQPDNIVIAAVGRRIIAFSATNHEIWNRDVGEGMFVKTLIVEKLLHGVHGEQIAALATGDSGSTISVWLADGTPRGRYYHAAKLHDFTLARLTARHGARLIAASSTNVIMLDPKDVESPLWSGKITPPERAIRSVSTDDPDHDGNLDIAVKLVGGYILYLDFDGHRVAGGDADGAHFELLAPR